MKSFRYVNLQYHSWFEDLLKKRILDLPDYAESFFSAKTGSELSRALVSHLMTEAEALVGERDGCDSRVDLRAFIFRRKFLSSINVQFMR